MMIRRIPIPEPQQPDEGSISWSLFATIAGLVAVLLLGGIGAVGTPEARASLPEPDQFALLYWD